MKHKGEGQGMMVSGNLVHNIGFPTCTQDQIKLAEDRRQTRIAANTDPNVKEVFRPIDKLYQDADGLFWLFHIFEYGKNKEGYWTADKMLEHMADVLDVLAIVYPLCMPVCLFDWSSCHDCLEAGAAAVSKMNVGVGGSRKGEPLPEMNRIQLLADTPNIKKGEWQELTFQPGDGEPFFEPRKENYVGMVKGMRQILWERGLFKVGMTKDGGKSKDPAMSMQHVLSEQPDFKAVPSSLEILVKRLGGASLMLPKYHCELNPIELVWGLSKHLVRERCNYTFEGLRKQVPLSYRLQSDVANTEKGMRLSTIQLYCRKIHTYHEIYRDSDKPGLEATSDYKVYKSHRRPAKSEFMFAQAFR